MQYTDALTRIRALLRPEDSRPSRDAFGSPTLADQEPDLIHETARYSQFSAAWAAGGHPTD